MPAERIIVNASPLILLCNSDLSFILPNLFTEIFVPDAVWNEIHNSPRIDKATEIIHTLDWLKHISVNVVEEVVRWDLGDGETEVLSFAYRHKNYTALVDDLAAKKCARSVNIPVLGTGSTLILAKERGLLPSVERALLSLCHAGMWISDEIIHLLKQQAGE